MKYGGGVYCFRLVRHSINANFANLQHVYGPWYRQNFISAQYLVNELMEFVEI